MDTQWQLLRRQALLLLLFCHTTRSETKLAWKEEHDVIQVLVGTTATFPWTYDGDGETDIVWYRRRRHSLDTIFLYTQGNELAYGGQRSRLQYKDGEGSASLVLYSAQPFDEDRYEVAVVSLSETSYIESSTQLFVISREDISYKITVNNKEFSYPGLPSGTPGLGAFTHTLLNITVTNDRTEVPPLVRVWKEVNGQKIHQPDCSYPFCNSYVRFCQEERSRKISVVIEIDFRIQNLQAVSHVINIHPRGQIDHIPSQSGTYPEEPESIMDPEDLREKAATTRQVMPQQARGNKHEIRMDRSGSRTVHRLGSAHIILGFFTILSVL